MKIVKYKGWHDYTYSAEDNIREAGLSFTLLDENNFIVACFGLTKHEDSEFMGAWLQHFGNMRKNRMSIIKAIKKCMKDHIRKNHSILTSINEGFPIRERFASWLGFSKVRENVWKYIGG